MKTLIREATDDPVLSAAGAAMSESVLDAAVALVRSRWSGEPRVGLVLGSGLGGLSDAIEAEAVFSYEELPGFHPSTAIGHRGHLVCGTLAGVSVLAMSGRMHVYEGHGAEQVAFPVHVFHALGCRTLIASNASGGLNPRYAGGDVMVLEDHVNLMGQGLALGLSGLRCGRTTKEIYDPELIERAMQLAREIDVAVHRGVYAAMSGPNYETRAEIRFLRRIADVVGMSTVPETMAAASLGMRSLAVSVVTNVACPDTPQTVTGDDVVKAAAATAPRLQEIVKRLLPEL